VRVSRRTGGIGGTARRIGLRHKTFVAIVGGTLAVLPALAASNGAASWTNRASTEHTRNAALEGGYDPGITRIGVDGSLPSAPTPLPLPSLELPSGPLGIPDSALRAYHHAADIMAKEQPGCHIDWALLASIGRIESNHARGGYLSEKGDTLEPILGPVLDGSGSVAAIPDTDAGQFDGDLIWDRAVGPMQFIPATWWGYAADGNGDGQSNPNNIYDASLATARYLCAGGLDLANMDQLRAAIFRYNNSEIYVETVILWANAYRNGVLPLPDSLVPIGAPNPLPMPAPAPVPAPPPPVATPAPPATKPTKPGGPTSTPPSQLPGTTTPPTGGPTTTTPTCTTEPPTTTPTPPTTTLPPCDTPTTTAPSGAPSP
jgi:hypothetical protein